MIAQPQQPSSVFSAEVRLQLEVDGQSYPVSCVGPDRLVLVEPHALKARSGMLIITIDGQFRTSQIQLAGSSRPIREYSYSRGEE